MHACTFMAEGGVRRAILGRGCDPTRAAFAKRTWEPVLNADVDTATSDKELMDRLTSGKKYEVGVLLVLPRRWVYFLCVLGVAQPSKLLWAIPGGQHYTAVHQQLTT